MPHVIINLPFQIQRDFSSLQNRLNTCETAKKSLQDEYDRERRVFQETLQKEREKLKTRLDNMLLETGNKLAKKDDEILELSSQIEKNNVTITQLRTEVASIRNLSQQLDNKLTNMEVSRNLFHLHSF